MRKLAFHLLCPLPVLFLGPLSARAEEPTDRIRAQLESEFRAVTGLGFQSFDCTYPNGWPGSREIRCQAVDEEGDDFFYRLLFEEGQDAPRVVSGQPVEQLNQEGLAALAQPAVIFLDAFTRSGYDRAFSVLTTSLQDQVGSGGLEDILEPMKATFGQVLSMPQPMFYSTPEEGAHQLDVHFETENGPAIGRFRLLFNNAGNPEIYAFLLTAKPGGALQARMLEASGKARLGQFFDQPIAGITGPLERLDHVGDAVEVRLVLEDGSEKAARVEQIRSNHDMSRNDYRFEILDSETIIGLHYASQGTAPDSISCPAEVAPDSGAIECSITSAGGTVSQVTLMRRGGQHRVVD